MTTRGRRILKVALSIILLLVVALGALLYRFGPDERGRIVPLFESIDMTVLPPFVRGIQGSQSITLFEGLPHQSWESELLETERSTKPALKSHGFDFYSAPISLSAEDSAALLRLSSAPTTFTEWRGRKLCGGYHPDWLIRWAVSGGAVYELHLCFGCHEAKIYTPDEMVYCDVASEAYKDFNRILQPYQKQRPTKPKP